MKPTVYSKRIVDAAMYVLFLLLMGQYLLRGAAHEWLGIAVGILFAIHNALNFKWYAALFKGRYTALRIVQTAVNALLIVAVLLCMLSGVLVSQHIFTVGNGRAIELGRQIHLVATAWAFVLMTVHLGLHWSLFTALAKHLSLSERAKRQIHLGLCLCVAALCLYGLYQFASRRFWEELFHLIDYQKEYDYTQSLPACLAGTLALSVPPIAASHYAKKLLLKRHGREKPQR